MKATGIVRRIEDCVIKHKVLKTHINTEAFTDFVRKFL